MFGHEQLALDAGEGAEDGLIGNFVGPELAFDHVSAGGVEQAHWTIRRMTRPVYIGAGEPAQSNGRGAISRTGARSAAVRWRGGREVARQSVPIMGDASEVRSQ